MTEILQAPERETIEVLLKRTNSGFGSAPTFERVLGFLTGAVITPGGFMASDWLPPLFDLNGIVFSDVEDIEQFTLSLVSLYDRIEAIRLRQESLCPFDMLNLDYEEESPRAIEWAAGLHSAVMLQEDIWYPYEDEADHVPDKLKTEVNLNLQCLGSLVDPSSIPETVKDPLPFQRNCLSQCLDYTEEMFSATWNDDLLELFKMFCLCRLNAITDCLQRYSAAYDEAE